MSFLTDKSDSEKIDSNLKTARGSSHRTNGRNKSAYLFKYLLLANFLQYLEAGAVPAMLLQLSYSFDMDPGQVFFFIIFQDLVFK
jgi:hypothetical protein